MFFPIDATVKNWALLSLSGLIGFFIGVSLSLLSLQYTSAGISSTITSIIPLSVLIFKEKIKLKEILGAIVTVAGVIILILF